MRQWFIQNRIRPGKETDLPCQRSRVSLGEAGSVLGKKKIWVIISNMLVVVKCPSIHYHQFTYGKDEQKKPLSQSSLACTCSINPHQQWTPACLMSTWHAHVHTSLLPCLCIVNMWTSIQHDGHMMLLQKIFLSMLKHTKNSESWANVQKCSINGEKQTIREFEFSAGRPRWNQMSADGIY